MARFINPSYEILTPVKDKFEILKKLELAGRVCYKSEDSITDDSCVKFVEMIKSRNHFSVLEHVNFVFHVSKELWDTFHDLNNHFLYLTSNTHLARYIVSGNARAWMDILDEHKQKFETFRQILKGECPQIYGAPIQNLYKWGYDYVKLLDNKEIESLDVHERLDHQISTVRFICNRGKSHELVRHRINAISQESSRFCNYSKNKFGSKLTFIKPIWFNKDGYKLGMWENAMLNAEKSYFKLINSGAKPEEARGVLPIDIKTEVVLTCNLKQWNHVFNLRCARAAHASMRQLMIPLREEFRSSMPEIFKGGKCNE